MFVIVIVIGVSVSVSVARPVGVLVFVQVLVFVVVLAGKMHVAMRRPVGVLVRVHPKQLAQTSADSCCRQLRAVTSVPATSLKRLPRLPWTPIRTSQVALPAHGSAAAVVVAWHHQPAAGEERGQCPAFRGAGAVRPDGAAGDLAGAG